MNTPPMPSGRIDPAEGVEEACPGNGLHAFETIVLVIAGDPRWCIQITLIAIRTIVTLTVCRRLDLSYSNPSPYRRVNNRARTSGAATRPEGTRTT